MNLSRQLGLVLLTGAAAAALTACGGGGSSGTVAPASLSVSGTAATGAAIAAGVVTLKCVSGTSTAATTGVDGSFTIDVGSVTLPCVGRVDYKNAAGVAQQLHTFIATAGTANITPMTELIVANLISGTAVDAFDKFDATKAKVITATQLTAAIAAIKTYFGTLGLAVTEFPTDPIGTKFVAKNGSAVGDKADALLDALAAKLLSSSLTLSNAVSAVTTSGTTTTPAVPLKAGELAASGTLTGFPPGITFNAATVIVSPLFDSFGSPPRQDASITIKNGDSFFIIVSGDVTAGGVGGPNALAMNAQSTIVNSGLEWNTSPLCSDASYPKNCKIQAGVVIDRVAKKITFTNAVLDLPFGTAAVAFGTLTLNGTVMWQ